MEIDTFLPEADGSAYDLIDGEMSGSMPASISIGETVVQPSIPLAPIIPDVTIVAPSEDAQRATCYDHQYLQSLLTPCETDQQREKVSRHYFDALVQMALAKACFERVTERRLRPKARRTAEYKRQAYIHIENTNSSCALMRAVATGEYDSEEGT